MDFYSATVWWKFAIEANLHCIREKNGKRTWSYLKQRVQDVNTYVKAYYEHLTMGIYMDSELKVLWFCSAKVCNSKAYIFTFHDY